MSPRMTIVVRLIYDTSFVIVWSWIAFWADRLRPPPVDDAITSFLISIAAVIFSVGTFLAAVAPLVIDVVRLVRGVGIDYKETKPDG